MQQRCESEWRVPRIFDDGMCDTHIYIERERKKRKEKKGTVQTEFITYLRGCMHKQGRMPSVQSNNTPPSIHPYTVTTIVYAGKNDSPSHGHNATHFKPKSLKCSCLKRLADMIINRRHRNSQRRQVPDKGNVENSTHRS